MGEINKYDRALI